MKTVYKPWGMEHWLELNDKYCYKRIHINAGHRTSYQYHIQKLETNFIIEGQAEVWLEDDYGVVQVSIMGAGDFFTVLPLRKHRVIAITDIILQEVSTPEVDDVIRIEDDACRSDGLIAHEKINPALCILAAGKGTRLDYLSKKTHKGLLPIQNKAIISHIIDKTPDYFDVVIAVGYKSEMVKEYCLAAHPTRKFIFVDIDDYDSKTSGPGQSFLACVEHLQRPFYLSTSDCMVDDDLPSLENNWIGVAPTSIPELYSTININDSWEAIECVNKTKFGFDYAFIGLCGIRDYQVFIDQLSKNIKNGELVSVFTNIASFDVIKAIPMRWHDVGTIDGYISIKNLLGNNAGLEKITTECFYNINKRIIKSNSDEKIVKNLITRAKNLTGLVPELVFAGEHFYAYDYIKGKTLYEYDSYETYAKFLDVQFEKFPTNSPDHISAEQAKEFYVDKTFSRVSLFLKSKPIYYETSSWIVNDVQCLPINETLSKLPLDSLCKTISYSTFHGDLQFDNVLYGNDTFTLIDWRESFNGNTDFGDVYYDLAKLYGGICMSYLNMKNSKNYNININENKVTCTWEMGNGSLKEIKDYFHNKAIKKGFDMKKIKILASLIHLNMAPLHTEGMSSILFFNGLKGLNEIQ